MESQFTRLASLQAMDYDPDVILYPVPIPTHSRGAEMTVRYPANSGLRNKVLIPSRTRTLPARSILTENDCLAIRFRPDTKTSAGVLIGTNPECDIVVPSRYPGISGRHLAFTFDENGMPIVRDLRSSFGTSVSYREHESLPRITNFHWSLVGPSITAG
jgi:hypothetical protein